MLVLSRGPEESILIGDDSVRFGEHIIKFTVLGYSGGKVRIGIEAPEDLIILREELAKEKCDENHHCVATEALPRTA
jgi:carbon storage regulator